MAERRMFAKTIIDSDAFLEMPQSTQLQIRSVSLETPKGLVLSCFTTGIKTDRPFDKDQV